MNENKNNLSQCIVNSVAYNGEILHVSEAKIFIKKLKEALENSSMYDFTDIFVKYLGRRLVE